MSEHTTAALITFAQLGTVAILLIGMWWIIKWLGAGWKVGFIVVGLTGMIALVMFDEARSENSE